MENQHQQIKGYRDLTQDEINAMNTVKATAEGVGRLCHTVQHLSGADERWVAIAITDLQKGFMALTRAIARPTTF